MRIDDVDDDDDGCIYCLVCCDCVCSWEGGEEEQHRPTKAKKSKSLSLSLSLPYYKNIGLHSDRVKRLKIKEITKTSVLTL